MSRQGDGLPAGDPTHARGRIDEVLDAAAAFYRDYLWTTSIGESIRGRIAREGVEEGVVREFGVGYIPAKHGLLEEHLHGLGFTADELYEAGIATRSRLGRAHSHFRSRIMFPIRDVDGTIVGFAGMATNPGPSWPLWLVSPDRGRFDKRTAIFALDRAAAAIEEAGQAVVFRDCLDVLRAHQAGNRESIALIRCSLTPEHAARIAVPLGLPPARLTVDRDSDPRALLIRPAAEGEGGADGLIPVGGDSREERIRRSETELRPDPVKTRTAPQRALLQVARIVVGVGIPLMWLAIMQPDLNAPGGADPALIGAIAGVAATYVVLALVSAVAAARVRARSRARRMRGAWEMGATEWQPLAWTYHSLEEILFAAALISAAVCSVIFVAVGGFTN